MTRKQIWQSLCLCLIFLGSSGLGWSIPATLSVSGRLLDAKGEPIRYYQGSGATRIEIEVNLTAELKFYDSETASTPIYTLTTTATAYSGYFNIRFTLPGSVLVKDQVYYTMAIDADRNALSSADLFAGRFQLGSVPYALSAKPAHAFTTHSGSRDGSSSPNEYLKIMMVAPFETPPGGVEFNRMNIVLGSGSPGSSFSFGIYDEQGKRVAYSGKIDIKDASVSDAFLEVKLSETVKLEPSKIYYTGLARNSTGAGFPRGLRPNTPTFGFVPIPLADGSIPTTFDPAQIDPTTHAIPLSITLTLVASPAPARQGVDPDKPQIRWIIPKNTGISEGKVSQK